MTSNGSHDAISVRGLHFCYDDVPVLHNVDLRLMVGERVALIGPNGSGKSTLLACINGFLQAGSGDVQLFGQDVRAMSAREIAQFIGAVPQEFQMPFAYHVRTVVGLGRSIHLSLLGALDEHDEQVIDQALERAEVTHLQGREFNALSGGERQRVVLALALAQEPDILLLDEPTAHLDLSHQIEVMELIGRVGHERGATVVASMHNIDLASAFFDRVVVLDRGRVVADGETGEVITVDRLRETFGVDADITVDPASGRPRVTARVRAVV
jgi:iron complex transport system ATP-binding protein